MANDGFNGTTVTFAGGTTTPLISAVWSADAARVDITGAGDAATGHTAVAGLPSGTITFTILGASASAIADEAAPTITWFDGSTDTFTNSVVVGITKTGRLDDRITTEVKVRPTAA